LLHKLSGGLIPRFIKSKFQKAEKYPDIILAATWASSKHVKCDV